MKKILIVLIYFIISSSLLIGQVVLVTEGTVVNSSISDTWDGVVVQRNAPTSFTFRNNSITSINNFGYMLQAGDEGVSSSNNNLDGELIAGNKFIWNGTDMTSITHGVFTGYNVNAVVKNNYLKNVPMGIIRKSNGMTNTSGGVAYNIIVSPNTGIVVKGMSGVNIYNNTLYSERSTTQTWRALIDIYANDSFSPAIPSSGTKVKNNIFYTKYQVYNISLESESAAGFECDYNIYYCESGTPMFKYGPSGNQSDLTFSQWQGLGYDAHSVIINPNFINTVDFVPSSRLDYGINLGTAWQTGLSVAATWTVGVSPSTANQNGTWQVGARVYESTSIYPSYVSSVIENSSSDLLVMTYSISLANVIPPNSAFTVLVNSAARTVNSVSISGNKVQLNLSAPVMWGDIVIVSYTKPGNNPLQTAAGGQATSINAQTVTNNVAKIPDPVSEKMKLTISPNPVHRIVNVLIEYASTFAVQDASSSPQVVRIFDISGKLFIEKLLVTGVSNVKIPINLRTGIYTVMMFSGGLQMASQKIMVY